MKRSGLRVAYCALICLTWLAVACGGGGSKSSQPASSGGSPTATVPGAAGVPKTRIVQLVMTDSTTAQSFVAPATPVLDVNRTVDPAKVMTSYGRNGAIDVAVQVLFSVANQDAADTALRTAWAEVIFKTQGKQVARETALVRIGAWATARMATPDTGAPAGEYEVTVNMIGTPESKSTKFTLAAAREPVSVRTTETPLAKIPEPAPNQPAKIANAILYPDFSFATYDKSDLGTRHFVGQKGFPAWNERVFALVDLEPPDAKTTVTAVWKQAGKQIGEPVRVADVVQGRLRVLPFPGGKHPDGDYEVTLSVPGDSRTLSFVIGKMDPAPGRISQAGVMNARPTSTTSATPSVSKTYDAWSDLYHVWQLESGSDVPGINYAFETVIKYQGVEVFKDNGASSAGSLLYKDALRPSGRRLPNPAGQYEFTVTNRGTNDKKSVTFAVEDPGRTPTPVPSPTPRVTPTPATAR